MEGGRIRFHQFSASCGEPGGPESGAGRVILGFMVRDPRVRIVNDGEGQLFAWSPDLPGCYTQGDSLPEAIANAGEAIELYLAGLHRETLLGGEPPPDEEPRAPGGAAWMVSDAEDALRAAGFARTHVLGGHQLCVRESVRLVFPFGDLRLHPKIASLIRQFAGGPSPR